ncbi:MAG: acyl-CoA thioesterase [Candidatus Marinimicrobia bacterium]|nr:acyl-CoA thioesterase [Candidatus Neomarinimicrobiota bacterium]MCH8068594.1 acyl-CoA thioesterase [Candidatus Neomarinimicrobiota bacterium]
MEKIIARYSQLVMPNDLNNIGTLFGGKMISWMDIAAGKAAHRFLRGTVAEGGVTKAVDKVVFSEPVYGGEWVNFESTIVSTGVTSFVVEVKATAENPLGESRAVCEALFTMVAVKKGKEGRWKKVPHGK